MWQCCSHYIEIFASLIPIYIPSNLCFSILSPTFSFSYSSAANLFLVCSLSIRNSSFIGCSVSFISMYVVYLLECNIRYKFNSIQVQAILSSSITPRYLIFYTRTNLWALTFIVHILDFNWNRRLWMHNINRIWIEIDWYVWMYLLCEAVDVRYVFEKCFLPSRTRTFYCIVHGIKCERNGRPESFLNMFFCEPLELHLDVV